MKYSSGAMFNRKGANLMTEADIMRDIQLKASELGCRLFRNNVGAFTDKRGIPIRFGLCVGSSDLIGYVPVTITEAMIGRTVAVFLAAEVKGPTGKVTPEQANFLARVHGDGGAAVLARSFDDVLKALEKFK